LNRIGNLHGNGESLANGVFVVLALPKISLSVQLNIFASFYEKICIGVLGKITDDLIVVGDSYAKRNTAKHEFSV